MKRPKEYSARKLNRVGPWVPAPVLQMMNRTTRLAAGGQGHNLGPLKGFLDFIRVRIQKSNGLSF